MKGEIAKHMYVGDLVIIVGKKLNPLGPFIKNLVEQNIHFLRIVP